MQRILVIRGGAIGDFVLTLPAIKLLRDAFPRSRLEILGYKHIIALAENRFYADATRSIEYAPLAGFFARNGELAGDLADYFHSFDLVVSWLFDPDRVFETNVRRCGVQDYLACSPLITGPEHACIQLARPLQELGMKLPSHAAQLYPTAVDRESAVSFLTATAPPVIALHPGSGSSGKNWPLAQWRKLGEQLLASQMAGSLVVVGGEADEAAIAALQGVWEGMAVRFARSVPLPALAAVLERCAFFVGHDSGISHIAGAVGTASVLLFGPTDPQVWAPANPVVRVLRAFSREMHDIRVCDVMSAAPARSS